MPCWRSWFSWLDSAHDDSANRAINATATPVKRTPTATMRRSALLRRPRRGRAGEVLERHLGRGLLDRMVSRAQVPRHGSEQQPGRRDAILAGGAQPVAPARLGAAERRVVAHQELHAED